MIERNDESVIVDTFANAVEAIASATAPWAIRHNSLHPIALEKYP